ncbi:RNA-directed DNA polymerase, eukaryota [Tanacetum coccineum]
MAGGYSKEPPIGVERLKPSQTQKFNVDDLAKISLTVYVSNFPSHLTIRELRNICSKYGTIVDVYIAKRMNKLGQMFAFCRYIKVPSSNALINSMSNVWIGKMRLHANVARFDRNVAIKPVHANVKVDKPKVGNSNQIHSSSNNASSYAYVAKKSLSGDKREECGDNNSSFEIQHDGSINYSMALLGCYKDFQSIENAHILCHNEGFMEVDIKYLGGLWILLDFISLEARDKFLNQKGIRSWFSNLKPWHDDFVVEERLVWLEIEGVPIWAWENDTFKSICNKWGDMIYCGDSDNSNRLSKRLCIKSTHSQLIFATTWVTIKKTTYAIRVRELCSWKPNFVDKDSDCDQEDSIKKFNGHSEKVLVHSDDEYVADILEDLDKTNAVEAMSNDPFGLVLLINKKSAKASHSVNSVTPPFPPGFTPATTGSQQYSDSSHNLLVDGVPSKQTGFSMLERLEETIKVGLALGLNMEGCESTLASLVWGNTHFDFAASSARGLSGGILCIWNSLVFIKHKILCNDYYVVVDGLWIPGDVQIRWIVVYAPQNLASKIALWSSLSNLMANWDGILVVMGDFNEVRNASERYGSIFNEKQADLFNDFISDTSLVDIPLGGYNYTWTNKWGSKMSKLDRFLVSDSFYDKFPHTTGVILEKGTPDHRPILLKEFMVDYGPTLFCLVTFKKKLQNLKQNIHEWVASKKSSSYQLKKEHQARLSSIDAKVDQGCASEEDFINRKDSLKVLGELDHLETKDLAQKAKLKWALRGDENSGFFHSTLKKKRRHLAIKGILKNGEWIEDPNLVKAEFLDHFRTRFKLVSGISPSLDADMFNPLSSIHNAKIVSDFRPISLIGCRYMIIGKILANRLCGVIGSCINPVQLAFIKDRNILDGPLILNEILAWYQERNKKLMVFKVDFEKAFDSLCWDFLDLVMEKLGFGLKWRSWIQGCLRNARSSILVNGSPTTEFEAEALGLIKGACIGRDNMSISYLMYADDVIFFGDWSRSNASNLISMLHCFFLVSGLKINVHKSNVLGIGVSDDEISCMANVIGCGVTKFPLTYFGIPIGCNMNRCSNWSPIIKKFSSKLSIWKARLLSLEDRLTLIKFVLGNLPTYYMSIYSMPAVVCNKLESMLNKFFISCDHDKKKMTWVKWKRCLASKSQGGLGIGSIYGLNIGLLFKWIWRFFTRPCDLWARVIQNIYGLCGGINASPARRSRFSTWRSILSSISKLKQKGVDLLSLCSRKIGNGASTYFWNDTWCGDLPFKIQYPRVYALDTDKNCLIANRISLTDWSGILRRNPRGGAEQSQFDAILSAIENVTLSDKSDSWQWLVNGCNGFSVASARSLVDSFFLDGDTIATRWNRFIPIKVNVFLWRLNLNKLPTRVNLDRKGIDIGSVLCPTCQGDVETVNHTFFNCVLAKDLWTLMAKWWELDIPIFANIFEWYAWLDSLHFSSAVERAFRRGRTWADCGPCWQYLTNTGNVPSLLTPSSQAIDLIISVVSLFFQPRTYNLSTQSFRDSVQIVENDLVVKKFPENDLDVKKFPMNDLRCCRSGEASLST